MQQVVFDGPGALHWEDVPEPELTDGAAVVRPVAVATCDIDVGVLQGVYPLEGPYPFGHEGVADVVAVADGVTSVAPGDRVVVPFQISCGACAPCLRGRTGNCTAHPPLSTFGLGPMGGLAWGGLLADLALVPHADAMPCRFRMASIPRWWPAPVTTFPTGSGRWDHRWLPIPAPKCSWWAVPVDRRRSACTPQGWRWPSGRSGCSTSTTTVTTWRSPRPGAPTLVEEDPTRRKVGAFPITVNAGGGEAHLRCALNSTAFDGTCTNVAVLLDDPALPLFQGTPVAARCTRAEPMHAPSSRRSWTWSPPVGSIPPWSPARSWTGTTPSTPCRTRP